MTKKPWERRLKDLSHLLKCCIDTYFDPELFEFLRAAAGDGKERVATMEVFEGDYAKSLAALKKLLK